MSEEKLIIVFDTETTNLPDYKKPSNDPCQPHLVELAASLYNEKGEFQKGMCVLIKPDGWVISDESTAIHGITHEQALAKGVSEEEAVAVFLTLCGQASATVAHNRSFDNKIMRIAIKRTFGDDAADQYRELKGECTAQLARPIMKLPATEKMKATNFKNTSKTPDLAEALLHFTGETLVGAHRASVDVDACAKVYFKIKGVDMPVANWWEA